MDHDAIRRDMLWLNSSLREETGILVDEFLGNWLSSIIDTKIIYRSLINELCSFYLINIIIFHWQYLWQWLMKLVNVPAEDFDHLIDQCHKACIWMITSIWKWWNRAFVWALVWRIKCQLEWCSERCFLIFEWLESLRGIWKSPKNRSYRAYLHKEVIVYLSWQQAGSGNRKQFKLICPFQ